MILWLAPIGAFGAIAAVVGKTGFQAVISLGILMGAFYLTCFLFIAVVLGTLLYVVTRVNIFTLMKYLGREYLLIVGTSSSEAALPRLIAKMEHLGVSKPVVGITVPTGYSSHLERHRDLPDDGLALSSPPRWGRSPMSIGEQIGLMIFMIIASKGAAGVTGAGLATLAGGLSAYRPDLVDGVGVIVGIDRFMSEARAVTNFTATRWPRCSSASGPRSTTDSASARCSPATSRSTRRSSPVTTLSATPGGGCQGAGVRRGRRGPRGHRRYAVARRLPCSGGGGGRGAGSLVTLTHHTPGGGGFGRPRPGACRPRAHLDVALAAGGRARDRGRRARARPRGRASRRPEGRGPRAGAPRGSRGAGLDAYQRRGNPRRRGRPRPRPRARRSPRRCRAGHVRRVPTTWPMSRHPSSGTSIVAMVESAAALLAAPAHRRPPRDSSPGLRNRRLPARHGHGGPTASRCRGRGRNSWWRRPRRGSPGRSTARAGRSSRRRMPRCTRVAMGFTGTLALRDAAVPGAHAVSPRSRRRRSRRALLSRRPRGRSTGRTPYVGPGAGAHPARRGARGSLTDMRDTPAVSPAGTPPTPRWRGHRGRFQTCPPPLDPRRHLGIHVDRRGHDGRAALELPPRFDHAAVEVFDRLAHLGFVCDGIQSLGHLGVLDPQGQSGWSQAGQLLGLDLATDPPVRVVGAADRGGGLPAPEGCRTRTSDGLLDRGLDESGALPRRSSPARDPRPRRAPARGRRRGAVGPGGSARRPGGRRRSRRLPPLTLQPRQSLPRHVWARGPEPRARSVTRRITRVSVRTGRGQRRTPSIFRYRRGMVATAAANSTRYDRPMRPGNGGLRRSARVGTRSSPRNSPRSAKPSISARRAARVRGGSTTRMRAAGRRPVGATYASGPPGMGRRDTSCPAKNASVKARCTHRTRSAASAV